MAKQKKMMNQSEKDARRPGNVARTKARKDAHEEAQELRRQANVVREHMGTLKPWEASCRLRDARRAAKRAGVELAA